MTGSTLESLATKYAATNALRSALTVLESEAGQELASMGMSKGEVPTPLGPVTLAENKAATTIVVTDNDGLIAWCEQNFPTALVHPKPIVTVNEMTKKQLLTERFVRVGDDVLDSTTGEVLVFVAARHTPAGPPTVRYASSAVQKEVKTAAADVARARADQLVAAVLEAHEALKAIES